MHETESRHSTRWDDAEDALHDKCGGFLEGVKLLIYCMHQAHSGVVEDARACRERHNLVDGAEAPKTGSGTM